MVCFVVGSAVIGSGLPGAKRDAKPVDSLRAFENALLIQIIASEPLHCWCVSG